MAGTELGFPKPGGDFNAREQLARKALRNIRLLGHPYVDLREDGKRYIFFCTLCLAPCYSDTILFDHLRGNLHRERLAAAKATLLGPNPWPFDDGVLFFRNSGEQGSSAAAHAGNDERAVVVHTAPSKASHEGGHVDLPLVPYKGCRQGNHASDYENYVYKGKNYSIVIPGVMGKEEVCNLRVSLVGYGKISAKLDEKDGLCTRIRKIWCEWFGKRESDDIDLKCVPSANDFAVVIFPYYYDLGKQGLFEEFKSLLMSKEESDGGSGSGKRPMKQLSNPEDISESLSNQCDSSGEDSLSSANSRLMLDHYNGQLVSSSIISSKSLRRELRRQQRLASERMCDICQHKMLPGKDVAALLNLKTGRMACSRRNVHGAFHVFHTSCLVHWILLCEFEMFHNKPVDTTSVQKPKRRGRGRASDKVKEGETKKTCRKRNLIRRESEGKTLNQQIYNVFCPNCQGSGMNIDGDELETPIYHLSEMFRYKIKMNDAHRAWMKHPEEVQNCSTGLHFSSSDGTDAQEKVEPMKLLHFYRADEDSWFPCP